MIFGSFCSSYFYKSHMFCRTRGWFQVLFSCRNYYKKKETIHSLKPIDILGCFGAIRVSETLTSGDFKSDLQIKQI
jgi:hypothetical protein